jgi:hypothetical protein
MALQGANERVVRGVKTPTSIPNKKKNKKINKNNIKIEGRKTKRKY